jgi:hypothetical protein
MHQSYLDALADALLPIISGQVPWQMKRRKLNKLPKRQGSIGVAAGR